VKDVADCEHTPVNVSLDVQDLEGKGNYMS
jgi:hypothetical protein